MPKRDDDEAAAIRKKRADYMRAWSQRRGAKPVKGTSFRCDRCGNSAPKTSFNKKWCDDCRRDARAEFHRDKRAALGTESVGIKLACRNCAVEITKIFKRQFYCDACSKLSEEEALPHQIENRRRRTARNMRERRRKYPKVAISTRMSAGIKNSLRDGKQGRSWESLVGYSVTDLMAHLESRFLPGMTWDNRGKWHIDHRRPLASFSFETPGDPDFSAAWALQNLQPLWALDNIRKSDKYQYEMGLIHDQYESIALVRDQKGKRGARPPRSGIRGGERLASQ